MGKEKTMTKREWTSASIIYSIIGAVPLYASWLRWPDAINDFGRELYAPWRLLEGERLYADIAWSKGPLSVHLNAAWFAATGVGIHNLFFLNAIIAIAILLLFTSLIAKMTDSMTAIFAGLLLVTVFVFGQYTDTGSYNYLAPHAHEMTHGLLLSLIALKLFFRYVETPKPQTALFIGFATGAVILTTYEFTFALFVGLAGGALALAVTQRVAPKTATGHSLLFFLAAFAFPLFVVTDLSFDMPINSALGGVFSQYTMFFTGDIPASELYWLMGSAGADRIGANVWLMAKTSVVAVAIFGALFALDRYFSEKNIYTSVGGFFLPIVLCAVIFIIDADLLRFIVIIAPRILTPLMIGLAVYILIKAFGAFFKKSKVNPLFAPSFAFTFFALTLLTRVFYTPGFHLDGFIFAAPATLLFAAVVLYFVPQKLRAAGSSGDVFRMFSAGTLVVFATVCLAFAGGYYKNKKFPVGDGSDFFYSNSRGYYVTEIVSKINATKKPGDTLVVFPEGAMINYMARMDNPTTHTSFLPPDIARAGGEWVVLETLLKTPPDFVLFHKRSAAEYGYRYFGIDYGQELYKWMRKVNTSTLTLADPTPGKEVYGMELLQQK